MPSVEGEPLFELLDEGQLPTLAGPGKVVVRINNGKTR